MSDLELYSIVTDIKEQQGKQSARLDNLDKAVENIAKDTRETRDAIVKAKGGWKALAVAGGVGGALAGAAVKYLPFLKT